INEFVTESLELLDELDRQFVALEADPGSRDRLASIFRVVHTIKGTSGLLGYGRLEKVTHAAENVLAKLRDGALKLTPQTTSTLLKSADAAREMIGHIAETRAESDADHAPLLAELKAILEQSRTPAPVAAARGTGLPLPVALPGPIEIRTGLPVPPPPSELL